MKNWWKRPRNRRLVYKAAAPLIGIGIGASCAWLPENFHAVCHLLSKVLALVGAG